MVASARTDSRDSHVVEIEFEKGVPTADVVAFINLVNDNKVPMLAGPDNRARAEFAIPGAIGVADRLQPKRDRFVAVRVPAGKRADDIAQQLLATSRDIKTAARRPMFIPASTIPSDPLIGEGALSLMNGRAAQWYLHRCNAPEAWKYSQGAGVIVADIDFGFDLGHVDLKGRFDPKASFNALDKSDNVSDGELAHGTGTAGLIGAAANIDGIVGFAPECTLWLVQAGKIESGFAVEPSDLENPWATAIEWVIDRDSLMRKVINLEIQSGFGHIAESSVAIQGAVKRAVDANVFVCIPAGNGGTAVEFGEDGQRIPATGSIVVAATGYDDSLNPHAQFSNFGRRVSVAAPGDPEHDVTCAVGSGYTENFGGTSGASAKVAGALALMLSRNPALTQSELQDIIADLPLGVYSRQPIGRFLDCKALSDAAANAETISNLVTVRNRFLQRGRLKIQG